MADEKQTKSSWVVGGGLLLGLGVGFFFLEKSTLVFVGSMFIGLGFGLLIAAGISAIRKRS